MLPGRTSEDRFSHYVVSLDHGLNAGKQSCVHMSDLAVTVGLYH